VRSDAEPVAMLQVGVAVQPDRVARGRAQEAVGEITEDTGGADRRGDRRHLGGGDRQAEQAADRAPHLVGLQAALEQRRQIRRVLLIARDEHEQVEEMRGAPVEDQEAAGTELERVVVPDAGEGGRLRHVEAAGVAVLGVAGDDQRVEPDVGLAEPLARVVDDDVVHRHGERGVVGVTRPAGTRLTVGELAVELVDLRVRQRSGLVDQPTALSRHRRSLLSDAGELRAPGDA
jgi:hypothetical protein